jgi:NAD/NADP transhydrogenase alpha subunit
VAGYNYINCAVALLERFAGRRITGFSMERIPRLSCAFIRGYDMRTAAAEQAESLGAKFLDLNIKTDHR